MAYPVGIESHTRSCHSTTRWMSHTESLRRSCRSTCGRVCHHTQWKYRSCSSQFRHKKKLKLHCIRFHQWRRHPASAPRHSTWFRGQHRLLKLIQRKDERTGFCRPNNVCSFKVQVVSCSMDGFSVGLGRSKATHTVQLTTWTIQKHDSMLYIYFPST